MSFFCGVACDVVSVAITYKFIVKISGIDIAIKLKEVLKRGVEGILGKQIKRIRMGGVFCKKRYGKSNPHQPYGGFRSSQMVNWAVFESLENRIDRSCTKIYHR